MIGVALPQLLHSADGARSRKSVFTRPTAAATPMMRQQPDAEEREARRSRQHRPLGEQAHGEPAGARVGIRDATKPATRPQVGSVLRSSSTGISPVCTMPASGNAPSTMPSTVPMPPAAPRRCTSRMNPREPADQRKDEPEDRRHAEPIDEGCPAPPAPGRRRWGRRRPRRRCWRGSRPRRASRAGRSGCGLRAPRSTGSGRAGSPTPPASISTTNSTRTSVTSRLRYQARPAATPPTEPAWVSRNSLRPAPGPRVSGPPASGRPARLGITSHSTR